MDALNRELGAYLKKERDRLCLTPAMMADNLGVSINQLANYEMGIEEMPFEFMSALHHKYGISLNDMVDSVSEETKKAVIAYWVELYKQ